MIPITVDVCCSDTEPTILAGSTAGFSPVPYEINVKLMMAMAVLVAVAGLPSAGLACSFVVAGFCLGESLDSNQESSAGSVSQREVNQMPLGSHSNRLTNTKIIKILKQF